jgi:uncharacterized protein (TIGR03083 family)
MTLPREDVVHGVVDELGRFEQLLRSLQPHEWAAPSRCAGWTAGDVAAHVVGGMVDVTTGRLEGLGTPEVTERQVQERRGRAPAEVADELALATKAGRDLLAGFDDAAWALPAPGGFDLTLGEGVESLWYDAVLHADDIRAAVGRPSEVDPAGMAACLSHVALFLGRQGFGPATLALDGTPEMVIGDGGGPRITGDPLAFLLAATGRADPAAIGLGPDVNIYR